MTAAVGEAPEEWAPIPGHHPYEASTDGRIRNGRTGRIIRCHSNGSKGYRRVEIGTRPSRGGAGRRAYVHELVLEAFIGPRPDEHEGHHRDFDRANNALDNLEWLPAWQNQLIRRNGPPPPAEWLGRTDPEDVTP